MRHGTTKTRKLLCSSEGGIPILPSKEMCAGGMWGFAHQESILHDQNFNDN